MSPSEVKDAIKRKRAAEAKAGRSGGRGGRGARAPVRVSTYRKNPDVTRTQAFRRWFGDSKVVDENGEPLVVYHGTDKSFSVFKSTTKDAFYGKSGMYFSNVREAAQTFAPSVEKAYLHGSRVGAIAVGSRPCDRTPPTSAWPSCGLISTTSRS